MGRIADFKRELEQRVAKVEGVEKVEWLGSMADTTFRQGKSDLDLIIWGKVATKGKETVSDIIRELNYKHELGLETAPYQHPTPFFVDNPAKELLYDVLVPKGLLAHFKGLRQIWKHHAPSYGQVWELEDGAQRRVPTLYRAVRRLFHELI